MTTTEATLILSFLILWGCAIFLVPDNVRSLSRYRLWRIRDYLQDCILDERLPDLPVVTDLLDGIEAMIQHSDHVRVSSFLAFQFAGGGGLKDVPFDLSTLSDEQKQLFNDILSTLYEDIAFTVIAGSPMGVFFLPLLLVWFKWRKASGAKPLAEPQTEFRRVQRFRDSVSGRGKIARDRLLTGVG